jgi:hypothetical protein
MKQKRDLILSASAITALKFCPISFYYRYVLGIRKRVEDEALRIGNGWHEGLDIISTTPETPCKLCAGEKRNDPDCYLCGGGGFVTDIWESVARMLNYRYSPKVPVEAEKKAKERAMIQYALMAYSCVYEDAQDYEVVFREIPFRIPLIDPRTRRAVPGVFIDGMLDKLVRQADGSLAVMEHKSTASDLSPKSDYWNHLKLDTQISLYVYAIQRLQDDGVLTAHKIMPEDPPITDILYDVWRKPQIKPKKLSAADTAKFIETGEYFGAEFDTRMCDVMNKDEAAVTELLIDGEAVVYDRNKPTKKEPLGAMCITETADMFGARLFDTITEDPEHYFCRKVLSRTPEEIEKFEVELFSIYHTIQLMTDYESWFHNEHNCEARRKCEYCPVCYSTQRIDPDCPPDGFKCIFSKEA